MLKASCFPSKPNSHEKCGNFQWANIIGIYMGNAVRLTLGQLTYAVPPLPYWFHSCNLWKLSKERFINQLWAEYASTKPSRTTIARRTGNKRKGGCRNFPVIQSHSMFHWVTRYSTDSHIITTKIWWQIHLLMRSEHLAQLRVIRPVMKRITHGLCILYSKIH